MIVVLIKIQNFIDLNLIKPKYKLYIYTSGTCTTFVPCFSAKLLLNPYLYLGKRKNQNPAVA